MLDGHIGQFHPRSRAFANAPLNESHCTRLTSPIPAKKDRKFPVHSGFLILHIPRSRSPETTASARRRARRITATIVNRVRLAKTRAASRAGITATKRPGITAVVPKRAAVKAVPKRTRTPTPRHDSSASLSADPRAASFMKAAWAQRLSRLTVGRSAASRASVASGPSEGEGGESAATPC
jgi:hypothetical protein